MILKEEVTSLDEDLTAHDGSRNSLKTIGFEIGRNRDHCSRQGTTGFLSTAFGQLPEPFRRFGLRPLPLSAAGRDRARLY